VEHHANGAQQAQAWYQRAEAFQQILEHGNGLAAVCALPHVGHLLYRATQFTDRRMLDESSVLKAANHVYGLRLQQINERAKPGTSFQVADAVGHACIELSNTLVRSDPMVRGSSVPFEPLAYEPQYTARAISQVFMVSVLKAVESRDIETVALMSDIAYCGWAMTRMDHERYSDAEMNYHLGDQWQIGLEAEPTRLYSDDTYRAACYEILEKQLVDLRSPDY
jgi:hypothetical protein